MRRFKKQSAAALVTILLLALAMTALAIGMSDVTIQNEKMVFNRQDNQAAFLAANSALVEGESNLTDMLTSPTPCAQAPCTVYTQNTLPTLVNQTSSWWQGNGTIYPGNLGNVDTAPYYLLEEYAFVPDDLDIMSQSTGLGVYYYNVSSRGSGRTDDAEVILQSIFSTRFN